MPLIDDGVTDNSAAFAALVAATPDHSTIDLPPGVVCIAGGIDIVSRTSLKFRGGQIKFTGAAANPLSTLGNFSATIRASLDCSFKGTKFDGNAQGPVVGFLNCIDSGLTDCEVFNAGSGNAQVASVGGVRSRFIDNIVHDSGGTATRGLWIGNVQTIEIEHDATISGNRVYNNSATGIVCTSIGGMVAGNNSRNNAGAGIVVSGNSDAHSIGVTVTGNLCSSNAFHGIQCDSGDMGHTIAAAYCPRGVTVTGNVCWSNLNDGIFLGDAVDWVVSGNVCFDNNISGIHLEVNVFGAVVSGNSCFDSRTGASRTQQDGIKAVANNADSFRHVAITGNICRNNKYRGIYAQENTGALMKSIAITGNSCNENDTAGIFLAEATAGKMTGVQDGNSCFGNGVDIRNTTTGVKNGTSYFVTKLGF
jgi:parallel beta-helix repeat protein